MVKMFEQTKKLKEFDSEYPHTANSILQLTIYLIFLFNTSIHLSIPQHDNWSFFTFQNKLWMAVHFIPKHPNIHITTKSLLFLKNFHFTQERLNFCYLYFLKRKNYNSWLLLTGLLMKTRNQEPLDLQKLPHKSSHTLLQNSLCGSSSFGLAKPCSSQ